MNAQEARQLIGEVIQQHNQASEHKMVVVWGSHDPQFEQLVEVILCLEGGPGHDLPVERTDDLIRYFRTTDDWSAQNVFERAYPGKRPSKQKLRAIERIIKAQDAGNEGLFCFRDHYYELSLLDEGWTPPMLADTHCTAVNILCPINTGRVEPYLPLNARTIYNVLRLELKLHIVPDYEKDQVVVIGVEITVPIGSFDTPTSGWLEDKLEELDVGASFVTSYITDQTPMMDHWELDRDKF